MTHTTHPRAYVELIEADRNVSDFLLSADLGFNGAGEVKTVMVDYKPGERVTESRVNALFEAISRAADEERTPFKILRYRVLGIIDVPINEPAPSVCTTPPHHPPTPDSSSAT